MEEVMEDLHHVTRQYLSCPDPVEAAARRQRVSFVDASGQMEETAASIIAAETRRHALFSQSRGPHNTPPPPLNQEFPLRDITLPAPTDNCSPMIEENAFAAGEDTEIDLRYREVDTTPRRESEGPTKLKSIVINPVLGPDEVPLIPQEPVEQVREDETLKDFQNKVKRRVRKPTLTRPSGNSPNILRGASSKKRKISQIKNSPARGAGPSKGPRSSAQKKATSDGASAVPPKNSRSNNPNPPINLIPARTKRSSDFQASPHLAP
ncbi:unnamed protein product [Brassica oleracea]